MEKILICDDDPLFHLSVKEVLKKEYQCFSAYHADEALLILNTNKISILLLDIQIPIEATPDKTLQKPCKRDGGSYAPIDAENQRTSGRDIPL